MVYIKAGPQELIRKNNFNFNFFEISKNQQKMTNFKREKE